MKEKTLYFKEGIDLKNWKEIGIEYFDREFTIKVPNHCEILEMKPIAPLSNPRQKIEEVLDNPTASKTLEKIIKDFPKDPNSITVAISVSDNTRPVPYHCDNKEGILLPILNRLKISGVNKENILIIVGCGTHQATTKQWKKDAFGTDIINEYKIIDHNCYSEDLEPLGMVQGVSVKVNKSFYDADIHIITGLVETHLMAGASGGRKAVCPGMVNIEATQVFHGPEFMENKNAADLVLKNNPCHKFALEVAKRTRIDFSVNVILNGDARLCGVFAGELEKAHELAVDKIREYTQVEVDNEYDIILTHGGKGTVNHYQAIKAAMGTTPAIKEGSIVILVAHNNDSEPIGTENYKRLMRIFMENGLGNYLPMIKDPKWQFTPDQWEPQKWEQFFLKTGAFDNLIYCTTNIPPKDLDLLPGTSGYTLVEKSSPKIEEIVQNAVLYAIHKKGIDSRMAFIKQGFYVVLKKSFNCE
jgi:nickel-dependent lactate racemase